MEKKTNAVYKEVQLDNNGNRIDRYCKNPLAKTFQYEYALYKAASALFASTRCRSMCLETLELYFIELPHASKNAGSTGMQFEKWNANRSKTQEGMLAEMKMLVERDVMPNIAFPRMDICAVEVKMTPEKDGTHRFVFTDGIYGFSLHLGLSEKGHPRQIMVAGLPRRRQ